MAKQDYEKLGVFYLGKAYDIGAGKLKDDLLLYDSKDLVTHAVCVGMTGSGKTGLCVSLIEEAALDSIPTIAIDPKGDLTNLLLTFPGLSSEEFLPWVNPDDARTEGLSVEDFATKQADLWRNGLAQWDEDGARIQRFKDAVDAVVYTPGSTAGIPLSILRSFAAPPAGVLDDGELFGDLVNSTATSLLTLLGIEADPIRSREHILLSAILSQAWSNGVDLDLESMIAQIQNPPVSRIGALDIESFYPSGERFKLAMSLNGILAAPGFSVWLQGEPLDIDRLLYTEQGKPKLSVISIAHLNDAQRMFFVSLLLNQVLSWMRSQSGTTALRALLYMDEIFGFFPPVSNPPSKAPLLAMIKQARAFGLGLVLATQNPVDLDYKGLANTGTWFIGRLQTERDKARLIDGLEGAAASTSASFSRQEMERTLASLQSRVFLMRNVNEDAPEVFQSRWALSYLRGPLTREQIRTLMAPIKAVGTAQTPDRVVAGATPRIGTAPPVAARGAGAGAALAPEQSAEQGRNARPMLPPDIPQFFAPAGRGASRMAMLEPMLYGSAEVRFVDAKLDIDEVRPVAFVTPIGSGARPVDWDEAVEAGFTPAELEAESAGDAEYGEVPAPASNKRNYITWSRELVAWLYRSQSLPLLRSPQTGLVSAVDEQERDFRIRNQTAARERRDAAAETLRRKYAPRLASLQERIRRAEQAVAREKEQVRSQQMQTAISFGTTILEAFLGRKSVSGTVGRATTAARGVGRTISQSSDVGRANETVESLRQQLADLEAEFQQEVDSVGATIESAAEQFETVTLKPRKTDIAVETVALVWMAEPGRAR